MEVWARGSHQEKLNARWGYGLIVGVRSQSHELVLIDQETNIVKYVRTVRRIPEDQRWQVDNLEWVQAVPWNMGTGDAEADGEAPEFDFKHGPETRLTKGEKADFEKFGFTDRCGGCSAILRGLRVQPHGEHCRRRMEKLLEDDVRIKNAKVRLGEKSCQVKGEETVENQKLQDIEEAAMNEENLDKLNTLFEEYRQ